MQIEGRPGNRQAQPPGAHSAHTGHDRIDGHIAGNASCMWSTSE